MKIKGLLLLVAASVLVLPACHWRKGHDCEECGVKKECKKHECHRANCDHGCHQGRCHAKMMDENA